LSLEQKMKIATGLETDWNVLNGRYSLTGNYDLSPFNVFDKFVTESKKQCFGFTPEKRIWHFFVLL